MYLLQSAILTSCDVQVFYLFGVAGIGWSLWWESLVKDVREADPLIAEKLEGRPDKARQNSKAAEGVPWRAFLRNRPVQALAYVHFCNNWWVLPPFQLACECKNPARWSCLGLSSILSHCSKDVGTGDFNASEIAVACRSAFVMTAWLPSYFSDSLSLSLTQASQAALFPPMAAIAASALASPIADSMVSKGTPVAMVRKTAQVCSKEFCRQFLALCRITGATCSGQTNS